MKKWHLLSAGMVAMQLIYPLCHLIAEDQNVNFVFYNQLCYELVLTVLFFIAGGVRLRKNAPASHLDLLLMPAVIVNGFLLMSRAGYASLIIMVPNLILAGVITFRRKDGAKIVVTSVCALAFLYMLYIAPVADLFSKEWEPEELIYQVESPSGNYTAQVLVKSVWLDDPETQVQIVNNHCVSVLFGEFRQRSQVLYSGSKQEHETIRVSWVDEDTLSINGIIYGDL